MIQRGQYGRIETLIKSQPFLTVPDIYKEDFTIMRKICKRFNMQLTNCLFVRVLGLGFHLRMGKTHFFPFRTINDTLCYAYYEPIKLLDLVEGKIDLKTFFEHTFMIYYNSFGKWECIANKQDIIDEFMQAIK